MTTTENGLESDWMPALQGPLRMQFIETIRSLGLERLQRYPPPKRGGLPLGHELRVLRRFVRGRSSVLDPSALSSLYRATLPRRDWLLYRAFILGDPLLEVEWSELVGRETLRLWTANALVEGEVKGGIRCRFRVMPVERWVFVVDPLDQTFPNRVHIGQDSLNLLEFLLPRVGRDAEGNMLDVGTGSGVILIGTGARRKTIHGIDINQRAVQLARLNAEVNRLPNCHIQEADVFEQPRLGVFDVVTWNAPFMFFPPSWRERSVDGYGGELGIELTLRFVELLPSLLAEGGTAYCLSAAPVLRDRENRLRGELTKRAGKLQLDVRGHVLQRFWVPALREFHRDHGIRHFESVVLVIEGGAGRVAWCQPTFARRAIDALRQALYVAES